MSKSRLPVIVNLDAVAKAWEAADVPARIQREHDRAMEMQQAARRRLAVAQKHEVDRRQRLLQDRARNNLIDHPLSGGYVGSSLGGPAPGPHYSHQPGAGVPPPPGGRGSGGRIHDRNDYTLQDVG